MHAWTPEAERELLLAVVIATDAKPPKDVWQRVSDRLGGDYSANAAKYYSLSSFICNLPSVMCLTDSVGLIVNDSTSLSAKLRP